MFRFLAIVFLLAQFAKATPRPNILFAIADDWGFGHAGAYGCKWVKTPAFDRVAREGILFTRAFTPNAKCAPSRAIILTGRYSWQLEEIVDMAVKVEPMLAAIGLEVEVEQASLETEAAKAIIPMTVEAVD